MHIAICDDNIADRKQMERLLKRESDARALQTEGFYVDSYGNAEALLKSPMLYDAFFIDMCHGETTGTDVVEKLTKVGVNAPIILCSSLINYQEYSFPSNILFLNKPIKKEELSETIDHAVSVKKSAIPHIELREESGEYYYVTEADILYAVSQGAYLKITLQDNKTLSILSTLDNLYSQLTKYPMIFPISKKVLINARHLQAVKFLSAYMCDGTEFRISLEYLKYTKYALKEFH